MTADPASVAAWTALIRASTRLTRRVEAALKAKGLPPLAWYDALWEIEKAGEGGIRPVALQDRLLLPQYGLSRLLDRLRRAGLIARADCPEDGRGQVVSLTTNGHAIRRAMWPVYAGVLRAEIGSRLSLGEAERLAALLDRLGPDTEGETRGR